MCHYTHLTPFERERYSFFLAKGNRHGRLPKASRREAVRLQRSYCPLTAQTLYKRRRKPCRPHKRLEYAPLHSYIQICILEYHWSPEEIVDESSWSMAVGLSTFQPSTVLFTRAC